MAGSIEVASFVVVLRAEPKRSPPGDRHAGQAEAIAVAVLLSRQQRAQANFPPR